MKVERIRKPTTHGTTIPQFDLIVVFAITLCSLFHGHGILKVTAGVLVTAFLPGYVFGLCIFPKRSQLREIERWGLALIVSTCIAMFLPFVLSATGWGVTPYSYSISLGAIMFVMLYIAIRRRRRVPTEEVYFPTYIFDRMFGWILLCVIAVSVVVTVIVRSNLTNPPAFFVTNTNGTFRKYPFDAKPGQKLVVELHLDNPTSSRLKGLVDASDNKGWVFEREVVVPPHSNLAIPCPIPTKEPRTLEKVTFWFRAEQPADSRMLQLSYRIVNP